MYPSHHGMLPLTTLSFALNSGKIAGNDIIHSPYHNSLAFMYFFNV